MKTEFMATIIVETKRKMTAHEREMVRKWLQKGLTVDEATYEKWPITNPLHDFPKATSVASPGTAKDWDDLTGGK